MKPAQDDHACEQRTADDIQVSAPTGEALTALETRAANADACEYVAGVDLVARDPHAGRAMIEIGMPGKRWCVWRLCLPMSLKADQIGG